MRTIGGTGSKCAITAADPFETVPLIGRAQRFPSANERKGEVALARAYWCAMAPTSGKGGRSKDEDRRRSDQNGQRA